MKDLIKLLLLVIPAIKDLVSSADDSVSIGKKIRIIRMLERKDLTKLEKIERILLRKGGEKVEIYGYVINGVVNTREEVPFGVVVNPETIEHYYDAISELKKKDRQND